MNGSKSPTMHHKSSLHVLTYGWYRSQLLSMPGAGVEFDRTTYYKIPFWQAADLIGKRQARVLDCVCRGMGGNDPTMNMTSGATYAMFLPSPPLCS